VIVSWHSLVLDEAIKERHSTRMFLPQSVPRALVDESLALAQRAPSSSNIQPWHMVFASGTSLIRLESAAQRDSESANVS
jgi:nitroreductase